MVPSTVVRQPRNGASTVQSGRGGRAIAVGLRWFDLLAFIGGAPKIPGCRGAVGCPGSSDFGEGAGLGLRRGAREQAPAFADGEIVDRRISGRPSVKISSISTVQRPTPRKAVRRAMSSASGRVCACSAVGTMPVAVLAAISRMAAIFAPEKPQARSGASSVASTSSGVGKGTVG